MPASIALRDLSYTTPDGTPLFSGLDLVFGSHRTGLIGRNGVGKSTLLRLIEGTLPATGGAIAIDGRLGFLRQAVQVGEEKTLADAMGIAPALALLDAIESGSAELADFDKADWTLPARLEATLAAIGISDLTPERPFRTLSGGQRTRVALAALMLEQPDMILLDEPTNNLDRDGREAVAELLRSWPGGAIIVSHDRELLEQMDATVELTSLGAKTYGGNWSAYQERKALELAAAEHDLAGAERRVVEIDRRIQQQRERKARRDGVGSRKAASGGIPRILLGGMKENAENSSGESARLATKQRQQAAGQAADARRRIEVLEKVALRVPSSDLPAGKVVLQCSGLTGGASQEPVVRNFDLTIMGPERVAITGPNGSGKTTLLRLLTGELAPIAGQVRIVERHAMLDQTVSLLDPSLSIRENLRLMNPMDDENACRAALARFLFRADAALQVVGSLSGGEMLRAGLACVLGGTRPPELLILDEPTNHLDIYAIQAVEAGLRAYDGALLVVSHDRAFLEAIGATKQVALGA